MDQQNNKPMLNILLLGNKTVGKTSLACRYTNEEYSGKCQTSIEVDLFRKDLMINDSLVDLQIWDTSGLDAFKRIGTTLYRLADCCIFVFDVTSPESFECVDSWFFVFFVIANIRSPIEFPVAVVGTKIDLENERKVSKQEAEDWCKPYSIPYFECSSKDDINVQQVFEAMTAKLVDTHKL